MLSKYFLTLTPSYCQTTVSAGNIVNGDITIIPQW